jgi:enediyne biosynthesis protein E4
MSSQRKIGSPRVIGCVFGMLLSGYFTLSVNAQVAFTDITEQAGIGHHQFEVYEGLLGGGVCVFDVNNDGWEDFFLTSGLGTDRLYLNKGDGTFEDIYQKSGLVVTGDYVTQGAASADVNRDGWLDLLVSTIATSDTSQQIPRAENLLFINNGNSTFRDATVEYRLDQLQSFSTGLCFGDFNIDGYPDVYIGNYFLEYEGKLSAINDATIVNANSTARGYLLLNEGGRYFRNVYEDFGLSYRGFGFGAVFTDYDNDSDVDLFVNHDFGFKATPNKLLRNEYPSDKFEDVSEEVGMDLKLNSMGTAVGDYNGDGLLDYYVTNIRFNRLMMNQGSGKPFVDKSKEQGMDFISISWGANFVDFDHDQDLDLFVANGDLNPNCVPLASFYFENQNGVFKDRAPELKLNDYGLGRGSAVFDMDNDGDLDIVLVNQKPVLDYPVVSETRLYRNDSKAVDGGRNWLKVALKGTDAELHGLGSRVEVMAGGVKMMREIDGGSSHLSQNSVVAHFGLGSASVADSVIVTWLGGKRQVLVNQAANQLITVTEEESKGLGWPLMVGLGFLTALLAAFVLRYFK